MEAARLESLLTVVMHTYERPDFVEEDVRDGRWEGIPLLIADDASSPEVQVRLESLANDAGARFTARPENGGPARAAHYGVEAAGTPYFLLCGDDDYLRGFSDFADEALALLQDPDVLFVTMPEVRFVIPGRPQSVQFDRRVFDGMTGRALLRELVFGGEMRALQAGTVMRSSEALPHFAGSMFRTSEDFVLLCRLCAERPDAVIRVPGKGAYLRREHPGSLSHRTNMSTGRAVTNLLGLLVGGRLLQALEGVEESVLLGLLRQRAQVINTVYGAGMASLEVIEAVLKGGTPPVGSPEAREALEYLLKNAGNLPRELVTLRSRLSEVSLPRTPMTPRERLAAAASAVDAEQFEAATELLANLDARELDAVAEVEVLRARIAWGEQDPNAAVRHLGTALVHEPEHAESLHMLAQIATAAGEEQTAARLTSRLAASLPPAEAQQLGISADPEVEDLRVAFVVAEGLDQFLNDIVRELLPLVDARKFVVRTRSDIERALEWADVLWFEWCNDPLVWASRQDIARQKPVICRLHRYEAFSDMPLRVQWDQVDALVVVAEHLAGIVAESIPGLHQRTDVLHIPNGVDMTRYELVEREPGFEIALVGYLHGRKNPQMALQIMRRLIEEDSRYRLHVAGTFQDPVLELYWSHEVKRLGLSDHVILYPWQDDIARFLEDKSYLLSTSLHESFGYSIAEAMARGIKPVVHHFPFADQIWYPEMLFDSVEDAVTMIRSGAYDSAGYRAFIEERYSLDTQVSQILELIRSLVRTASGGSEALQVEEVQRLDPKMVNAELACRCPSCRAEVGLQLQTIAGHPVTRDRCRSCGATIQVGAEQYRQALIRYKDRTLKGSQASRSAETRRVAENWAEHPVWRDVMTVEGINLGTCMAFDLTPHLVRAWLENSDSEVSA